MLCSREWGQMESDLEEIYGESGVVTISSYWNKRDLNQLLPQNNKGLKGHLERFEFVILLVQ